MEQPTAKTILVTGASGFIGSHCVLDLLNHGYHVRGSIRDKTKADRLTQMFNNQGADTSRLSFVEASLTDADSWQDAASDCAGIFHIASPVPTVQPKNADEVIGPAKTGTLNVLHAAKAQGVERVVLTSSVAAIFGGVSEDRGYSADDWSDPDDPLMTPYSLSKTIAEQAAWQYCRDNNLKLSTVNPALVLGPALEADYGSSLEALIKLLKKEVPLLPRFGFEIVDVRDVAILHRLAFEKNSAIDQRLIAANGFLWFRDIAALLKSEFPDYPIPTREMPNWLTRLASIFVPEIKSFLNDLDLEKHLDITPARDLGWQPRTPVEAVSSGARSLIDLHLV